MIGAMPAVAVRHERRRQEKRSKRPSQLYLGGPWLPPPSPSPTPSPGANGLNYDADDRFPEYYVCGKVSALQLVVGFLLVGAIILVVGLVQLTPGAADADHRWILLGTGGALIASGLALTAVRCCCMKYDAPEPPIEPGDLNDVVEGERGECECEEGVRSIDGLVQRRDTQIIGSPSELAALIKPDDNTETHNHTHSHQHTHSHSHNNAHRKDSVRNNNKANVKETLKQRQDSFKDAFKNRQDTLKTTRTDSVATTRTESLDSGGGGT